MADVNFLRQAETELASAVLPEDPDSVQQLTTRDQLLTRAYLVLACALVEDFIEGCFLDYVKKSMEANDGLVSSCFVPLAIKFADDLVGQVNTIPSAAVAAPMLVGLYSSKVIHPNNGVKRKNLEAMARPLGLRDKLEDECDDLLGPADTLGARRGSVAHTPAVSEEMRPNQARELVTDVLERIPLLTAMLDVASD